MDRAQKKDAVAELQEVFENSSGVVVMHYRGLSVAEISELRAKAREQGARIKVTKNSLAKIAANDGKFSGLADILTGPTAIAYSDDEVSPAKVVVEFAKDNEKLAIIGGAYSAGILDEAGVKALASTPSLDESRAKLVGLLQAPAGKLASVVQAPAGQLARVFGAYAAK